jgi:AcrR family transcriptional regulator
METRQYRMKVRAERQAETRQRIVDAAVELHSTLGPTKTSLSAIADRAGVQRHTLYAHFPDEESLFRACSSHWRTLHPFPDPERWLAIDDPRRRLQRGLSGVYDWYASVEDEFAILLRDSHVFPKFWREREASLEAVADLLAEPFGRRRKLVRAAVGHAIQFETWRSLVRREGLSQQQAVSAMVDLVAAQARTGD